MLYGLKVQRRKVTCSTRHDLEYKLRLQAPAGFDPREVSHALFMVTLHDVAAPSDQGHKTIAEKLLFSHRKQSSSHRS